MLGEGVLPHEDIARSVKSVESAVAKAKPGTPAVVLARSRSSTVVARGDWLRDTFIAQLWCNRDMMTSLAGHNEAIEEVTLLKMLPQLIREQPDNDLASNLVLVDGTSVLSSVFDLHEGNHEWVFAGNAAAADGEDLYIGRLDLALVLNDSERDEDGKTISARIAAAPWPPEYVLERVATAEGLVIVNNVNCGYLDMATNLLQSIQNVSDAEVRHMRELTQTCPKNVAQPHISVASTSYNIPPGRFRMKIRYKAPAPSRQSAWARGALYNVHIYAKHLVIGV